MHDDYVSAGEAARLLMVSPKTVSRWADEGRLECMLTLGGHRRFPRAAVLSVRDGMQDRAAARASATPVAAAPVSSP